MGTFHHDKSQLHGITVVVDTTAGDTLVGRCEDEDERQVILLDADVHRRDDATSREDYLDRADRFGVWAKHPRLAVPRDQVTRMFPLGELKQMTSEQE